MTRIKWSVGGTTIFDDAGARPGDSVLTQAVATAETAVFEAWQLGNTFAPGDIRSHDGKLWRMIGAASHTALDANWQPGTAVSLWAETWPSGVIPEWRQPQGAHDAYPLGFKVTHNGQTWENTGSNANVWEPGVFGWTLLDGNPDEPTTEAWVSGESIEFDPQNPARRTYNDVTYQLRQNPGINIWPPPTVPALWEVVVQ